MNTIGRSQAIEELRAKLLSLVDERTSPCAVAARRGVFCRGFAQWSDEELKQRFPWFVRMSPGIERERLEKLANRWMLGRQHLGSGRLPCDVPAGRRARPCHGWDEFYEGELARFNRELGGGRVRVVPDEVVRRLRHSRR